MKIISTASKTNKFPALLRKSGFRATPSRLFLLAVLQENRQPMSAQNIIDTIRGRMDQATVYRTLKSLKAKGLIRQVDLMHNHAHYEIANLDEHHHLICLACGRIEDVHGCEV